MTISFHDLEAHDSNAKRIALDRLDKIIQIGAEQQKTIVQQMLSLIIVDKLVDPTAMSMEEWDEKSLALRYWTRPTTHTTADGTSSSAGSMNSEVIHISNHALGQMCSVARIPKTYVNALLSECVGLSEELRLHLICYLFNTHFRRGVYLDKKGNPTKFLHRILYGEIWGFLSRNYNRKLGTAAMLRPFLEECALQGARPTEAHASPLRAVLKCVLPVIFEPIPGEFVAFGATYTNSDFGAGSLLVQGVILRISSGTSVVLEAKLKKIHLGAVISDEEIELSEETLKKESETHASAVRDMVKDVFSPINIERSLKMVEYAATHKIAWDKLLDRMKELLNQSEIISMDEMLKSTQSGIIDLPSITVTTDGDPEANAWWAAAALGIIAGRVEDVDRKASIHEFAGRVLKSDK